MPKGYEDPLFARQKKPRGRGLTVILLILLVIAVAIFLLNAFNNRQVQLVRQPVTIPSMSTSFENYRILHLSDLHGSLFGQRQEGIISTIGTQRYDAVCISGDMVGENGDYSAFLELIEELSEANKPIYFVAGDEDPDPLTNTTDAALVKADYILAAEALGAIYLDAPVRLSTSRNTSLWLCPDTFFTLDKEATKRTLESYRDSLVSQEQTPDVTARLALIEYRLEVLSRFEQARLMMLSGDTYIILTHVPYTDETVAAYRESEQEGQHITFKNVSLVLAGHYNNGQLRLPVLGAIWLPPQSGLGNDGWMPDNARVSGLSLVKGVSQYITPGLGSARIFTYFPWRFYNSPCISLVTLTTKLTY